MGGSTFSSSQMTDIIGHLYIGNGMFVIITSINYYLERNIILLNLRGMTGNISDKNISIHQNRIENVNFP